jgi:uncharacterized Zn-binding protein involved in type VI secretion
MPAAVRIGDADVPHCSSMVRAEGSPNVRVNGRPISRQGDFNTPHLLPDGWFCVGHSAPIAIGSTTVRVNGLGAGRIGDVLAGCTFCGSGSFNVFIGG